MQSLQDDAAAAVEQPLDRQLALASRERALNVLRDQGYPYADVTITDEESGAAAAAA